MAAEQYNSLAAFPEYRLTNRLVRLTVISSSACSAHGPLRRQGQPETLLRRHHGPPSWQVFTRVNRQTRPRRRWVSSPWRWRAAGRVDACSPSGAQMESLSSIGARYTARRRGNNYNERRAPLCGTDLVRRSTRAQGINPQPILAADRPGAPRRTGTQRLPRSCRHQLSGRCANLPAHNSSICRTAA